MQISRQNLTLQNIWQSSVSKQVSQDAVSINDKLHTELKRLETLPAKYRDGFSAPRILTRSNFDMSLKEIIKALILKDEVTPIMVCNKIRTAYLQNKCDEANKLETLASQAKVIVDHVLADPDTFCYQTVDMTRTSVSKNNVRKNAEGIVFHDGSEKGFLNSLGYGLQWADDYDKGFTGAVDKPKELLNCSVATFEVNNPLSLYLKGNNIYEYIIPGFTFNSNIKKVLLTFNLKRKDRYSIEGHHILLYPGNDDSLKLYLTEANNSIVGETEESLYNKGEEIGYVFFDRTHNSLHLEATHFADTITRLLES